MIHSARVVSAENEDECMKKILELITEQVQEAFEAAGYDKDLGKVTLSNRPDLCEYQCNGAMAGAKLYHKAPIMIAKDVEARLADSEMFEEVSAVAPGFLNLKLTGAFAASYLNEMRTSEKLGVETVSSDGPAIVDFGGANAAKPLHVGHLRSAIIGESIKRLLRFMGDEVLGDVHLGDWGLQMGLIIEELHDRKPELPYFDESYTGAYPEEAPFTISELEEIYPAASAKSKVDEDFAERAHQATLKLQSGDPACTAIWKHIMSVSLKDLKRNYANLNVEFDLWKGESDAQPYIPDMIEDLKQRGIAHESQGALVVDVQQESDTKEIPPCIVQKSDGAALYATSDLATILEREKLYQPSRYIYVADKRQELHFTQVFRTARMAGYVKPETKLDYVGFGTMNGRDGKPFKTRSGGVMRLETLIADINEAVYEKIMENRTVSEEEARETARKIGLAAIKYGDLSNQASKDYVFDIDRFTAFEGNTGPYMLYTIVRIKSILKKYADTVAAGWTEESLSADSICAAESASEKALMLQLARFGEMMTQAYDELAIHRICAYMYDLSNAFNSFYHDTKILAETDGKKQTSYIALICLVKQVLLTCTDLLGIEAPERM